MCPSAPERIILHPLHPSGGPARRGFARMNLLRLVKQTAKQAGSRKLILLSRTKDLALTEVFKVVELWP